ncbi:putative hydrolase YxeP [compost metagenome]
MALALDQDVKALADQMIQDRRDFHMYPELGFEETRTAAKIVEALRAAGIDEIQTGVAKTGVVALIRGRAPGKTVLLRADIDALPVTELNDIPYRSRHDGKMHACGHDAHTAMLLATARVLHARRAEFDGIVKLVFQPAEEGPGGALPMIEEGVMENPKVDAALGLHIWNLAEVGTIGVRSGPVMANTDEFTLTLRGRGGHGAMPHLSVDAITVAGQVISALQNIVSRQVSPLESAVVTIGTIHGGERHNIIAHEVTMTGTVRTFAPEVGEAVPGMIERIIRGITTGMGAEYDLEYHRVYPATINDPRISDLVRDAAAKVVGWDNVMEAEASMGGEDMAYFLQKVPGCYFFVGSANPAKGLTNPHHHPAFDIDEAAMPIGVQVMVQATLDTLAS